MSSSPRMDDYSSEDYSDHDDDYCFVPSPTSPQQVEIRTCETEELQNLIVIDQQEVMVESVYFEALPELESRGGMEQSIYFAVESYFGDEAEPETGGGVAAFEAQATQAEEFAVEAYTLDLDAQVGIGSVGAVDSYETVLEPEVEVIGSEPLETEGADTALETVERLIEEFNFEAVESDSDLEAEGYAMRELHSDVGNEIDGVAPGEVAENVVEGVVIGEPICKVVESDHDLQAEAGDLVEEAQGKVEGDDVVEVEEGLLEEEVALVEKEDDMVKGEDGTVEDEDVVEEEDGFVEDRNVIEAEGCAMKEIHSVVQNEIDGVAVGEVAQNAVEGDVIGESMCEVVESHHDLLTQAGDLVEEAEGKVEGEDDAVEEEDCTVEEEDVVEEGDGTVEKEDVVQEEDDFVEEEHNVIEPEGYAMEELHSVVEREIDGVALGEVAQNAVEGHVIGDSTCEVVESDHDLQAKAEDLVEEAQGQVEGDHVVEVEEDVLEEEDGLVRGEDDVVEEEDEFVEEEHNVMDEPLESHHNPRAKAQALVEGVALEESLFKPLESNFEPAVLPIEMTTLRAHEPDFDLEPEEPEDRVDDPSGSIQEEFDLYEEDHDSDAQEFSVDPKDWHTNDSSASDEAEEEEEDDVVVFYLNSPTTTRSRAWPAFLVPASEASDASEALASWASLPVTDDTPTRFEDSSLLWEGFLGCRPMLVLQEFGNAVMNVIETLLCELSRIRDDLRRFLGALFGKRETTKNA